MAGAVEQIRESIRQFQREQALLFLNYVLAVSREDVFDANGHAFAKRHQTFPPPFVVHFIAKELILHASDIGVRRLDWPNFEHLYALYFELDDPIAHDLNWKKADPTGFFERLFSQQFPAQNRNFTQKFGLTRGLFRESFDARSATTLSLRSVTERALGVSIDEFMALGFLAHSLRQKEVYGHKCNGTFSYLDLAEAYAQGIRFSHPDAWPSFLKRTSCSPNEFREYSRSSEHAVQNGLYYPFEFNLLHRFPLIQLTGGRFIAVDPNLVLDRVSGGLFFDNLSDDKLQNGKFLQGFGHCFSAFIGDMLKSVVSEKQVVCLDSFAPNSLSSRKGQNRKIGDWAINCSSHTVLIEC